jgi:hypothetical protein
LSAADWSGDLLESDRRYFEAGAELLPIPGAVIAVLRGAEKLAAGCVVQRIDARRAGREADSWLSDVERNVRAVGVPRARLYLEEAEPELEAGLRARGYRPRLEHGFVRDAGTSTEVPTSVDRRVPGLEVELVPAEDETGWAARRGLLAEQSLGVDGHALDPDLWVTMERRKHEAGYMRPLLIRASGQVVGAVCAAPVGRLLRMKNLVIDAAHRRRRFATATAIAFAGLARDEGLAAAGCFALEGEPALAIYPKAGYRPSATQTEWVRDLE